MRRATSGASVVSEAACRKCLIRGPSAHEADTYFLIRAYADLGDLNAQQNAFYGSEAWRLGPRESVISLIETYLNTVLWLSQESIDDLRRANPAAP